MKSDTVLAKIIQDLIYSRGNDEYADIESHVHGGIRYIAFTAMDSATFRDSYTWVTFMSDIMGLDDRKETFGNPHFMMDFRTLKFKLMSTVNVDDKMPIVLYGHGVGGALAVIAGYYLTMKHKNLKRVVTFGAPAALNFGKVNEYFYGALQQITNQYVLKNDPLPKMFRWTKYKLVDRTVLDSAPLSCGIGDYVDSMAIGDGGLL